MFCNRCGKIIPPSMTVINGMCPAWACIKAPKLVVKPKIAVTKLPKTVSKPLKVVQVPVVVVITVRRSKVIKIRDIKREMDSRFVRPWK